MNTCAFKCLCVLSATLAPLASNAFMVSTTSRGAEVKWSGRSVSFWINANSGPAGASTAIVSAMNTWSSVSGADFHYAYGGPTAQSGGSRDYSNVCSFGYLGTDGTIAETTWWANSTTGVLSEGDIVFNTYYSWSVAGSAGAFDVQNIATHELGHCLSLDDLYGGYDMEKTMYGYATKGETKKRTLDPDDLAGVCYLYPVNYTITTSSSPSNGGSTSGAGTYVAGSWRNVTATANNGYAFANWTEYGTVVSVSDSYSFALDGNRNLTANFTANLINYTIAASAGAGGTINPSGNIIKIAGSSQAFTASPSGNRLINQWLVDGVVVQNGGNGYTLSNIQFNQSVQVTFAYAIPGMITLVSPSGSFSAGSTLCYTWKTDAAATWYELCVVRNGSLFCDKWFTLTNSVIEQQTGSFAVYVSGHTGGNYQWWVRGWSPAGVGIWSSPMNLSVGIPGAVALLAPANNASISDRHPEFTWSQSFPAATWFHLYVTRDQAMYLDQWIAGATNWTPTTNLLAGSYSWSIQSYNVSGLGPWSAKANFSIPRLVPGILTLVSPVGGSVTANLKQRYTWKAEPSATWYNLYVVQNGEMLCDQWITLSNSVAQSGSGNFAAEVVGHTGGNYQWWVRGWSPDALGPWSGPGSYTMTPPPPPGAVTLLTPTNNASGQERQPTFTWSASSPEASWYYVYLVRDGSKYLDQWVPGTTNWVPATDLPSGICTWAVRPWSAAGYGPWSTNFNFTIQTAVPGTIMLVSPSGTVAATSTQRYTWKADAAATWYELYVVRNGSAFGDHWYALADSAADPATGNFVLNLSGHSAGSYQWWVRGWSVDGLGTWSSGLTFQIP